jgi:hypothetical protein
LYGAEAHDPAVNDASKDVDPYERFRYMPQFGEGYAGKKRPTLYLFRWEASTDSKLTNSCTKLIALSFTFPSVPVLLGQAVFASEDRIFVTGYEYTDSGRLLGVKGCFNRPAGLWMLCIPQTSNEDGVPGFKELVSVSRLTPPDRSGRSPRVLSGDSVFWLSNEVGGAHASCVSLHSLNLLSMEKKTILDTMWQPGKDGFPGLYPDASLPSQPFIKLGSVSFIVTHSTWGSRNTVLLIATDDGRVKDLTPEDGTLYSWTVLGTDGANQVVCARSSLSIPHEVLLGRIDNSSGMSWQILSLPTLTPESRSTIVRI